MGRITIKTEADHEAQRVSGRMAGTLLMAVANGVKAGVTTYELGEIARAVIADMKAENAFFGYHGFPGQICVSVNEEVVHGVPGPRVIQNGDLVSLDVGLIYDGFVGDNATTVLVGKCSEDAHRLRKAAFDGLNAGIAACVPGARLSDVSHAIELVARKARLSVVREYVGHGIGREMHEEPQVPNFGKPGKGPVLKPGMTLCLEPMFNVGRPAVKVLDDGWSVVTKDGSLSAHVEHMVAITKDGPEVLSVRDEIVN